MNEEKKVPFKWEYGEETISLQLGMYANNQRLYIQKLFGAINYKAVHVTDSTTATLDADVDIPNLNQSCRAPPLCDTVVSGKYFIAEADQLTASILTAHADVSVTQAKSE